MNYNYSYEQTIYTSAYFNRIIDSELSKTPFYTKIIEDYKKVTKDPIESLAKRIIVINHGAVGFDGTIEELAEKYAGGKRCIRFTLQEEAVLQFPERMRGHLEMQRDGRHIVLHFLLQRG